MRLSATVAALLAACSAPPANPEGPAPGGGVPYPMVEPGAALAALASDFSGSCAFARPGPDAGHYRIALVVTADTAVRASATFAGDANRIGTVGAGGHLRAEGPLAGGRDGGSGYAVVVRDSEGRVCRGYVSAADVAPATKRARGRSR